MTQSNLPIAVDSDSCNLLLATDKPFIYVLKMGDSLFESLLQCANTIQLKSGIITGIGALESVTVAYYNLRTKTFQKKLFTGIYELISLTGNISSADGKPYLHIHAALGKEDYSVFGGHIMDAVVSATAEICITPLSGRAHRKYNEAFATKMICPGLI